MKRLFNIFAILFIALNTYAQLRIPNIFGNNMMLQQNTEAKIWGWANKGKKVTISPSWSNKAYTAETNKSGKWEIKIPTPTASYTPYDIKISDGKETINLTNILIGEVWLCSGQSNMEMPMKGFKNQPVLGGNEAILKSKNKNIRLITVKRDCALEPKEDIVGEWDEAKPETVKEFSATAYYYGRLLNEILDVPVGMILASWGGSYLEAWMDKEMLTDFNEIKIPATETEVKEKNRTPTTLYNGMINPIAGYTIKGCIWYQGESNYDRADQYASLFPAFVSEWRKRWEQGEFPFYYCQIAPYNYELIATPDKRGGKFNTAFLREAQYKAAKIIPNSGMAVLMDIGEEECIHPQRKSEGGERLAMLALAKTYGISGFGCESPTYKEMSITGNVATLSFDNAPMWLTSFGKSLDNFEIAGTDKKFYPAKAEIKRSKIEVSSEKVSTPVAVRYAFRNYVKGDLFSTEGLPISSFRTDDWDE